MPKPEYTWQTSCREHEGCGGILAGSGATLNQTTHPQDSEAHDVPQQNHPDGVYVANLNWHVVPQCALSEMLVPKV